MPFSFYVLLVASLASRWVSTVKQSRAEFFFESHAAATNQSPFWKFFCFIHNSRCPPAFENFFFSIPSHLWVIVWRYFTPCRKSKSDLIFQYIWRDFEQRKWKLWKLCCIEGKPQNWVVHTDLEISFNLWLLESTFSIRNSKVKLRLRMIKAVGGFW